MQGPGNLAPLLHKATIQLKVEKGYAPVYPAMCDAARILARSNIKQPLTAIAHMAYGWMPTILKRIEIDADHERDLVARVIRICKHKEAVCFVDLYDERNLVNNSWVGTSKVLHFLNPKIFPIWDSKVALHFGSRNANRRKCYSAYLQYVADHIGCEEVADFKVAFHVTWGYEVSEVRALELLLFLATKYDE